MAGAGTKTGDEGGEIGGIGDFFRMCRNNSPVTAEMPQSLASPDGSTASSHCCS
jgi:hypothetical protein